MSDCPKDLRYTKSHEWIKINDDNTITVGITAHAQSQLGDLVFVDGPELNAHVSKGEEVVVVESVKTAADVYAPVAGEVIKFNEQLDSSPDLINKDPYGEGWLYQLKIDDADCLEALMTAEAYQSEIADH